MKTYAPMTATKPARQSHLEKRWGAGLRRAPITFDELYQSFVLRMMEEGLIPKEPQREEGAN